MKLRIVTPIRPVVDADVTELVAPGSEGEFGVLAQHVSFLGGLKPGVISWVEGGQRRKAVISGGYAEVRQDVVTVLADDAEFPEEINVAKARADVTSLQEELARGTESGEVTQRLLRDLALAEARAAAGAA
jgi:F-type H+-transporting ATPase subunit epsilon